MNQNFSLLSQEELQRIDEFRKSRQTAILAILFTDIVGSTAATEMLGEQSYTRLRHIHDTLFKRIVTGDDSGRIIKEIGDSFLCVFSEPSTAVDKAIEFQEAIEANSTILTTGNYTIKVRIGIHLGQVAVENNLATDIFGRHVNRAARIQSIANGGQVLTSKSIWENAIGWLKSDEGNAVRHIYYGSTKLKGIDENVDIYGFYSTSMMKPSLPSVFYKKRKRRVLFLASIALILSVVSALLVNKANTEKNESPAELMPGKIYAQFDFSSITELNKKSQDSKIMDTVAMRSKLLAQLIALVNPMQVVTEEEVIRQFASKGKFYKRHPLLSSDDAAYFNDTIGVQDAMIFKLTPIIGMENTILKYHIVYLHVDDESVSIINITHTTETKNLVSNFRSAIQEALLKSTNSFNETQGIVLSANDSIVYFKKTDVSSLQVGAYVTFMRDYVGENGLRQQINDEEGNITFIDSIFGYSSDNRTFLNKLKNIWTDSLNRKNYQGGANGVGVEGEVTEIFDSIGVVKWRISTINRYARPMPGDFLRLNY